MFTLEQTDPIFCSETIIINIKKEIRGIERKMVRGQECLKCTG